MSNSNSDSRSPDDDVNNTSYDVGFCKPPKATRFAKGQSGNPKGRPKGKRNFATTLNAALNQKVTITEHGRQRQVTKLEAMTTQMANKAATGDMAALRLLVQIMPELENTVSQVNAPILSDAKDQQIIADMLRRFQTGTQSPTENASQTQSQSGSHDHE